MTFAELFVGGGQAHGQWHPEHGAKTIKAPALEAEYANHLNGVLGLGLVPVRQDGTCRFGAVDIDVDTIDHQALFAKVAARRMPLTVCRSKSGGAHLYIFFRDPGMLASQVQGILKRWANLLGYPAAEIFPKQVKVTARNLGNWINLPYFDAARTTRYAVGAQGALSLDEFLTSVAFYDPVMATQVDESAPNAEMPPCLQALAQLGLSEGQRNQGLFNFAVFFRKSCPKDWEEKVTQHNEAHLKPPLTYREVQAIITSVGRTKYQYLCDQAPIVAHCDRKTCMKMPFGVGHMPWDEGDFDEFLVGRVRKLTADPPRYVLEVNGHDLELSASQFLNFNELRRRVMELMDIVVAPIKQKSWELQVKALLQAKEEVEAPPEVSMAGAVTEKLLEFIALKDRSRNLEDLLRGLPVTHKGHVIFRSSDLRRYLQNQRLEKFEMSWLFQLLKKESCEHSRQRVLGKILNTWRFPLEEGQVQDEPFAAPEDGGMEEL